MRHAHLGDSFHPNRMIPVTIRMNLSARIWKRRQNLIWSKPRMKRELMTLKSYSQALRKLPRRIKTFRLKKTRSEGKWELPSIERRKMTIFLFTRVFFRWFWTRSKIKLIKGKKGNSAFKRKNFVTNYCQILRSKSKTRQIPYSNTSEPFMTS